MAEKDGLNKFIDSLLMFNAKGKTLIYELEWNENEIIWRINNLEIYRQTQGIPNEEMYLSLSCGIYNEPKNQNFPTSMHLDWVQVYKTAEKTS